MDKRLLYFGGSTILASLFFFGYVNSCNEAVCGSVVSKCLLTQSCNCDFKNCTCCKDCYNCLGFLYSECCSCVDMCPNIDTENDKRMLSYVEDFEEAVPGLFLVLADQEDGAQGRWISKTFPVDFDISQYNPKKKIKIHMQTNEQEIIPKKDVLTLNCTVLFMSECMSNDKCKKICKSMGASGYRWFHDACCECIGEHCINYGINESRCKNCPIKDNNIEDEDFNEDDLIYDDYDSTDNKSENENEST